MATSVMVLCALLTTVLVARRELLPPADASTEPVYVENWRDALPAGISTGSASAPVQLVEFADFECPYCARYHQTLKDLRDKYQDKVAVTFAHYPLPMHKSAERFAIAAECANTLGRFDALQDVLYGNQASAAQLSNRELAESAGIPDAARFEACMSSGEPKARVTAAQQIADTLGVDATPTILLNGWRLARPPSSEEFDRMIASVLEGDEPVDGYSSLWSRLRPDK